MKVAFVSNRFENPLEDIVFLDAFHLKTQNTTFKSFTDDSTVLQYQFYYFHKPHRFDGGRFFSQITTLKTVPSDEKSNCRTCAEGCQMPFNVQFHSRPQRPRSFWSAPRIATSGQVQHRKSAIHGLPVTLRMFRVKFDKSDWFWSQSIVFTKPFKNGMPLD